ncbi:MAG TPA: CocE/NonD family hydrolase, partial [Pirellulales bacterium]|nr:CocE/NonD family hydrolase [Pirellulales bacterium]
MAAAFVLVGLALGAHAQTSSQQPEPKEATQAYLREHYTKYEFKITMRDGIKLFTAVYTPKDTLTTYPILLTRTPYNVKPYGVDQYPKPRGPMANYAKEKFIFVLQDVRGRFGSEGVFSHVRPHNPMKQGTSDIDESTDCYDTIDWLVKNVPNNNGKVGMMGISYPGFYT